MARLVRGDEGFNLQGRELQHSLSGEATRISGHIPAHAPDIVDGRFGYGERQAIKLTQSLSYYRAAGPEDGEKRTEGSSYLIKVLRHRGA